MVLVIAIAIIISGATFAMQYIKKDDRKKGLKISDGEYTIGGTLRRAVFKDNHDKKRYSECKKEIKYIKTAFILLCGSAPIVAVIDIISGNNTLLSLLIIVFTMFLLIYAAKYRKISYVIIANIALVFLFIELIKLSSYSLIPYVMNVILYDIVMGMDMVEFYKNNR